MSLTIPIFSHSFTFFLPYTYPFFSSLLTFILNEVRVAFNLGCSFNAVYYELSTALLDKDGHLAIINPFVYNALHFSGLYDNIYRCSILHFNFEFLDLSWVFIPKRQVLLQNLTTFLLLLGTLSYYLLFLIIYFIGNHISTHTKYTQEVHILLLSSRFIRVSHCRSNNFDRSFYRYIYSSVCDTLMKIGSQFTCN